MAIRGWDEFVKEAESLYEEKYKVKEIVFPLSEDETYTVPYPTLSQIRRMDEVMAYGDYDTAALLLFGEELGNRLIELSDDLHVNPLIPLINETIQEFGLSNLSAIAAEMDEDEKGKASPEPSEKSATARKRSSGGAKQ